MPKSLFCCIWGSNNDTGDHGNTNNISSSSQARQANGRFGFYPDVNHRAGTPHVTANRFRRQATNARIAGNNFNYQRNIDEIHAAQAGEPDSSSTNSCESIVLHRRLPNELNVAENYVGNGERLYGTARTNTERVYGEVRTDAYPVDAGARSGGYGAHAAIRTVGYRTNADGGAGVARLHREAPTDSSKCQKVPKDNSPSPILNAKSISSAETYSLGGSYSSEEISKVPSIIF